MTTRLTIFHKGLILIAVPLFFQLAFIGLVARMRRESSAAEVWTIHTKEVIAQAQRCRVRLLSAHGSIQGYILTRDPRFEAALTNVASTVPDEIEQLKKLASDNPSQTKVASEIQARSSEFLAFMTEGRDLVRDNRMDAAKAATRRLRSQVMLEALEGDFDRFLGVETDLDRIRHDDLNRSWRTLDGLLWGGIITSIFFTLALAVLFTRNISGRIAKLTENNRRLASGTALNPPIGGGDEIARLDQVFHEMAATLVQAAGRERTHAEVLERRAEELAVVNDQLREKAQENEMFVYSVSHDLRSPLVNLQGFSKELGLIGKDLGRLIEREEIPPEIRGRAKAMIESDMEESIGFIQTAVTRLSSIIDALLRLSRAGRVEYRRQSVDVNSVVERVVSALRKTIEERAATVEIGGLPPASGDPTAVEQVFANLIGNAINYLDRSRPGRIEVFAVEGGEPADGVAPGSVVYAVRDNGLGISEPYKAKVFTAFQRLHGDVAKGEGIGLALVRRMVERHGGRVWFESEQGRGTTFFVAFLAPEVEDAGTPVESRTAQNGRKATWQPSR